MQICEYFVSKYVAGKLSFRNVVWNGKIYGQTSLIWPNGLLEDWYWFLPWSLSGVVAWKSFHLTIFANHGVSLFRRFLKILETFWRSWLRFQWITSLFCQKTLRKFYFLTENGTKIVVIFSMQLTIFKYSHLNWTQNSVTLQPK